MGLIQIYISPKVEEEIYKIKDKYRKKKQKVNKVDIVVKLVEDYFPLKEKYNEAMLKIKELENPKEILDKKEKKKTYCNECRSFEK